MKRNKLFTLLVALSVTAMLTANITAFKMIEVGPLLLPSAVFIFPFTYAIGNIVVELFGAAKAKWMIWVSFAMNLIMVLYMKFSIALPAPVWFEHAGAYETVLGGTWRLLAAGLVAFLAGSFMNVHVFAKLKGDKDTEGFAWRAMLSSVVGEGVDASIFITLAFVGTMPSAALLTMIVSQAGFKVLVELAVLPVATWIVNKVA